jgi:hypothetical protein
MPQTVAGAMVGVLEQIWVKHVFGLIGDSLNPLADAVSRFGVRHHLPRGGLSRSEATTIWQFICPIRRRP